MSYGVHPRLLGRPTLGPLRFGRTFLSRPSAQEGPCLNNLKGPTLGQLIVRPRLSGRPMGPQLRLVPAFSSGPSVRARSCLKSLEGACLRPGYN